MSQPAKADFSDDVDPWELLDQGCLDDPFYQQLCADEGPPPELEDPDLIAALEKEVLEKELAATLAAESRCSATPKKKRKRTKQPPTTEQICDNPAPAVEVSETADASKADVVLAPGGPAEQPADASATAALARPDLLRGSGLVRLFYAREIFATRHKNDGSVWSKLRPALYKEFGLLEKKDRTRWVAKLIESGTLDDNDKQLLQRHPWFSSTDKSQKDEFFLLCCAHMAHAVSVLWCPEASVANILTHRAIQLAQWAPSSINMAKYSTPLVLVDA